MRNFLFVFIAIFFVWSDKSFSDDVFHSSVSEESPAKICTSDRLDKRMRCSDRGMMNLFMHDVNDWFVMGDFESIENGYKKFCRGLDRFPDGSWYLSHFNSGLYGLFRRTPRPRVVLEKITKWQSQYPGSMAALYAEALYWKARSSVVVGEDGAIPDGAADIFLNGIRRSYEVMEKVGEKNFDCAVWNWLMIDVLVDINSGSRKIEKFYRNSVKKYPQYHDIHFAMARKYSLRLGGSMKEYQNFALRVAGETASFEGMGMYARLVGLEEAGNEVPFGEELLATMYWGGLKQGYADLMQRYPLSMSIIGKYADLACRAGDKDVYLSLRQRLDGAQWLAPMVYPVEVCDMRHGWED